MTPLEKLASSEIKESLTDFELAQGKRLIDAGTSNCCGVWQLIHAAGNEAFRGQAKERERWKSIHSEYNELIREKADLYSLFVSEAFCLCDCVLAAVPNRPQENETHSFGGDFQPETMRRIAEEATVRMGVMRDLTASLWYDTLTIPAGVGSVTVAFAMEKSNNGNLFKCTLERVQLEQIEINRREGEFYFRPMDEALISDDGFRKMLTDVKPFVQKHLPADSPYGEGNAWDFDVRLSFSRWDSDASLPSNTKGNSASGAVAYGLWHLLNGTVPDDVCVMAAVEGGQLKEVEHIPAKTNGVVHSNGSFSSIFVAGERNRKEAANLVPDHISVVNVGVQE